MLPSLFPLTTEPEPAAAGDQVASPAGPQGPALELRSIVKDYGQVRAVRGVDLVVNRGEFLTVLGPSGSGKTTILRLIAGFVEATSGEILLGGRDVSRMSPAERGIGMVFQNYALFPHMTAAQNVAYGLKMRGWSKARQATRVEEVLELVGLREMHHRLPRELSGGQQQRVALARALAFGPTLLLMDEPLGALDRELRIRMAGELRRIQAELQATVVYVTHDREEALTLSDRIAIMHNGTMDALDVPDNLYMRPASRFVASFFGGHNLVPAEVISASDDLAQVSLLGTTVEIACSERLTSGSSAAVVVPTHAITVADSGGDVAFDATVESLVYLGEVLQVVCSVTGLKSNLIASIPTSAGHGVTAGGVTRLAIDCSRCVALT